MVQMSNMMQKLEAIYPDLSPQLRRAARYIQKHPADIALYPLRRVAAAAEVGPTTMVRLAADLGFATYDAFRDEFRQHLKTGASRYAANASRLLADKEDGDFFKAYEMTLQMSKDSLAALPDAVAAEDILRTIELMESADKIYLLGLRPMYAATFYFYYVMKTFSTKFVLIEDRMSMLIDELGPMTAADLLLVISFEPYAADSIKATEYAAALGAKVIALTDSSLSPLAASATQALVLPTTSGFYQSLIPTLAVLETIVAHLLARSGQTAVDRITAEFERRERFGVYWRDQT
jgi:DNA-binding MurR/RpiR family transcriptional regulator